MSSGIDRSAYINAFRAEMEEHLLALSEGLIALENRPEDRSAVAEVFRRAHTIKGSARMMGFGDLARLAHAMEDILDDVRARRLEISPGLLDALLAGVDLVRDLVAQEEESPEKRSDVEAAIRWLRGQRAVDAAGSAPPTNQAAGREPSIGDGVSTGAVAEVDGQAASEGRQWEAVTPRADAQQPTVARKTVRVDVDRIDTVLNLAGELTLLNAARRQWMEDADRLWEQLDALEAVAREGELSTVVEQVRKLSRAAGVSGKRYRQLASQERELAQELHYQISGLRMLPVRSIFSLVPRAARDLAREKGKEVEAVIEGEETEIDREVLEQLRDPLLHLVRNAIDHGIEPPGLRLVAGKPRIGRLRVGARIRGEQAIVEVEDDGFGVDLRRVRDAAVREGLLSPDDAESLDDEECLKLLFRPGFSTSDVVSDISGRGVGLDVVKARVDGLRGDVRLETQPGLGTRVAMELPISLAFRRVLLFEVGRSTFAVRLSAVRGILGVSASRIRTLQGRDTVDAGGLTVPLVWADRLLGMEREGPREGRRWPALLLGRRERPIAFVVDQVLGEENVIVKPLGPLARRAPYAVGGIILGSGRVALLLSSTAVVEAARATGPLPSPGPDAQPREKGRRVLVVDDSAITRELERSVLEAAGYQVVTAVDGHDALARLRTQEFALVVTDIQMPGMDGFDLTAAIRADARLSHLPVVIVSSRESSEDKRRGLEVGAQAYVGKGSFDQLTLLDTIDGLIG